MKKVHFALLIPAFNEEQTIRSLVKECFHYCQHIVVVDDGSTDHTVNCLEGLPVKIIRNNKNYGKGTSLTNGLRYLKNKNFEAVITLDADNQHDPKEIPKFLAAYHRYRNHIIIGARQINAEQAPLIRLFANKLADFFISWTAGKKIRDTQSGYRLYPHAFIQKAVFLQEQNKPQNRIFYRPHYHQHFVFESQILIDAVQSGYPPICVPILSCYPEGRRNSYYRPLKDTGQIAFMLIRKLFFKGFYPKGLWHALTQPAEQFNREGGQNN